MNTNDTAALAAANVLWDAIPHGDRTPLVSAMRETMAAELQQPQHGPQLCINVPACVDLPAHNDAQLDAVPVLIQANLSAFACRAIAWSLRDAINDSNSEIGDHEAITAEAWALVEALETAGQHGDFLPQSPDAYNAADEAGLTDRISEQRARAAHFAV